MLSCYVSGWSEPTLGRFSGCWACLEGTRSCSGQGQGSQDYSGLLNGQFQDETDSREPTINCEPGHGQAHLMCDGELLLSTCSLNYLSQPLPGTDFHWPASLSRSDHMIVPLTCSISPFLNSAHLIRCLFVSRITYGTGTVDFCLRLCPQHPHRSCIK